MEDIKELLREHGINSAAFDMRSMRCYLYIPTNDRQHHLDIISDWDRIEANDTEDSEIVYCFMNLFPMSEEEQEEKIQEIVDQGGTRLL